MCVHTYIYSSDWWQYFCFVDKNYAMCLEGDGCFVSFNVVCVFMFSLISSTGISITYSLH